MERQSFRSSRAIKKPIRKGGVHAAITDPADLRELFATRPHANYGIATGARSSLIVLDVDGSEGEGSLRALEKRHGRLPVTVVVRTARGRHLYFRHSGNTIPNSAAKLGRGLDVRGDGGYVVGVRSNHPSGRHYEYAEGLSPDAVTIARLPEWIVGLTGRGSARAAHVSPQRVPLELRERAAA